MKVWEMDKTDVVKFEITRDQWNTLIEALAGAAVWSPQDKRSLMWDALDVLRSAEDVIETTAMQNGLKRIHKFASIDETYGSTYQRIVEEALRPVHLVSPARHSNSETGKGDLVVNDQTASLA